MIFNHSLTHTIHLLYSWTLGPTLANYWTVGYTTIKIFNILLATTWRLDTILFKLCIDLLYPLTGGSLPWRILSNSCNFLDPLGYHNFFSDVSPSYSTEQQHWKSLGEKRQTIILNIFDALHQSQKSVLPVILNTEDYNSLEYIWRNTLYWILSNSLGILFTQ